MISTDIFGRGIDVGKVNVVINYDMPQQKELSFEGRASD
jgi:superfamily II DNA/RNA helicase